jgi:hypothetical protein
VRVALAERAAEAKGEKLTDTTERSTTPDQDTAAR